MLGHEVLGVVERDGHGYTRGDLVTATVRRSCRHCLACSEGFPDSCLTGDYVERGITRLNGFARELVVEDPGAARSRSRARSAGSASWRSRRRSASARCGTRARSGTASPGSCSARSCSAPARSGRSRPILLRLAGLEVWTASLEPSNDLVTAVRRAIRPAARRRAARRASAASTSSSRRPATRS